MDVNLKSIPKRISLQTPPHLVKAAFLRASDVYAEGQKILFDLHEQLESKHNIRDLEGMQEINEKGEKVMFGLHKIYETLTFLTFIMAQQNPQFEQN